MVLSDLMVWCRGCTCRKGDKTGFGICAECWSDWKIRDMETQARKDPMNYTTKEVVTASDGGLAF